MSLSVTTSMSQTRRNVTLTQPTALRPASKRRSPKRLDVSKGGILGPLWTCHPVNTWISTGILVFASQFHPFKFRKFEDLYNSIAEAIAPTITNITGCKPPCSYLEYRFNDDPIHLGVSMQFSFWINTFFQESYGDFGFVLWNMSPNLVVETESLLYNFESLVAEFGGTLGLFVGFSFMVFWDCLEFVLKMSGKIGGLTM